MTFSHILDLNSRVFSFFNNKSESNPTEFRVEWSKFFNYSWSNKYFINKINFVKRSGDWSLTKELPSVKVLVAEEPICQVSTLKLLQFCMVMGVISLIILGAENM